ncbi:hypothetical protein GW17_00061248 [Ensete ventricosum]|nr:hypothetical protein GW17_00061248 [Ensete ventricosum]
MCNGSHILRKSYSRQYLFKAQWTKRVTRSHRMISNEVMHWWMHFEIKWGSNPTQHHTKVIQLAEVKLRSGYLSTGQKDAEASTLGEYAIVLSFELSETSGA